MITSIHNIDNIKSIAKNIKLTNRTFILTTQQSTQAQTLLIRTVDKHYHASPQQSRKESVSVASTQQPPLTMFQVFTFSLDLSAQIVILKWINQKRHYGSFLFFADTNYE